MFHQFHKESLFSSNPKSILETAAKSSCQNCEEWASKDSECDLFSYSDLTKQCIKMRTLHEHKHELAVITDPTYDANNQLVHNGLALITHHSGFHFDPSMHQKLFEEVQEDATSARKRAMTVPNCRYVLYDEKTKKCTGFSKTVPLDHMTFGVKKGKHRVKRHPKTKNNVVDVVVGVTPTSTPQQPSQNVTHPSGWVLPAGVNTVMQNVPPHMYVNGFQQQFYPNKSNATPAKEPCLNCGPDGVTPLNTQNTTNTTTIPLNVMNPMSVTTGITSSATNAAPSTTKTGFWSSLTMGHYIGFFMALLLLVLLIVYLIRRTWPSQASTNNNSVIDSYSSSPSSESALDQLLEQQQGLSEPRQASRIDTYPEASPDFQKSQESPFEVAQEAFQERPSSLLRSSRNPTYRPDTQSSNSYVNPPRTSTLTRSRHSIEDHLNSVPLFNNSNSRRASIPSAYQNLNVNQDDSDNL